MRTHTGETPYLCTDCLQRFRTRNTYKRHLRTRHGKTLLPDGIHATSRDEFPKVSAGPRLGDETEDVAKSDDRSAEDGVEDMNVQRSQGKQLVETAQEPTFAATTVSRELAILCSSSLCCQNISDHANSSSSLPL